MNEKLNKIPYLRVCRRLDRYLVKAKRKDSEQWVRGAVLFHDTDAATIFNQHLADGSLQGFEVDLSTVCQCTGLKDRADNLIWENDIMKDKHNSYRVVWDNEEGAWMLELDSVPLYGLGGVNSKKYEVIGNVFDNPKLL